MNHAAGNPHQNPLRPDGKVRGPNASFNLFQRFVHAAMLRAETCGARLNGFLSMLVSDPLEE